MGRVQDILVQGSNNRHDGDVVGEHGSNALDDGVGSVDVSLVQVPRTNRSHLSRRWRQYIISEEQGLLGCEGGSRVIHLLSRIVEAVAMIG